MSVKSFLYVFGGRLYSGDEVGTKPKRQLNGLANLNTSYIVERHSMIPGTKFQNIHISNESILKGVDYLTYEYNG